MKPADLALSTPRDFLRYQGVLLSAPTDLRRYERAVQPAVDFQPVQCLFGYDAQLHAFAKALRRVGIAPWFLPAPDVYASSYATARLLNSLDDNAVEPGKMLHLRFGAPWTARVLRGATNLAVLAGVANEVPLLLENHPFGSATNLPAAFAGILTYQRLQAPVTTFGGRDLPACSLDDSFVDSPLLDRDSEELLDHTHDNRLQGEISIQSVLEFTAAAWELRASCGVPASLDFRRALIRRNVVLPGQKNPLRFSLLPWNMANGRSVAPDMAVRLSSDKERSEYEHGVILLPYNEGENGALRLQALVNECRAHAAPGCAETVFLMRATSLRSILVLRSMVTNCWLDGSDPEWRWNARRLAGMGFKTLLILGPGMEESFDNSALQLGVDAVFQAENSRVVRSNDGFGERFWRVDTVSTRGLRKLLQYTRRVPLSPS